MPNLPTGPQYQRPCAVCGATMTPFVAKDGIPCKLVAHEFKCFKTIHRSMVPQHQLAEFESTLAWETRSIRAKAAAAKRRIAK